MTRGGDPPPSSESGSVSPSSPLQNSNHRDCRRDHGVSSRDNLPPPRPPPQPQQRGIQHHEDHRLLSQRDPPGFHVERNRQRQRQQRQPADLVHSQSEEGGGNSVASSLVVLISDEDCAAMQAAHMPRVEERNRRNQSEQQGPTVPSSTAGPAAAATTAQSTSSPSLPPHIPLQLSEHEKDVEDSLLVLVPSVDCETLRRNEQNERHRNLGGNQQPVLVEMELATQIVDQQRKMEAQLEMPQQRSQEEDIMMNMVPSDECVILNQNDVQERQGRLGGNQQLEHQASTEESLENDWITSSTSVSENLYRGHRADPPTNNEDILEEDVPSWEETKEPLEHDEPVSSMGGAVGRRRSGEDCTGDHGSGSRNSDPSFESFDHHSEEESKKPIDDQVVSPENADIDAWFPFANEATETPAATAATSTTFARESVTPTATALNGNPKRYGEEPENLLTSNSGSLRVIDLAPYSPCRTDSAFISPLTQQQAERNESPMDAGNEPPPLFVADSINGNEPPPLFVADSINLYRNRLSPLVASINDDRSRIPREEQAPPDPTVVPTKHGAYYVIKVTPPGTVTYDVLVPDKCGPGDKFLAQAGNRLAEVAVPADYLPGEPLEFECPADSVTTYKPLKLLLLTASPAAEAAWKRQLYWGRHRSDSIGGAFPMHGPIREINEMAMLSGKSVARTHVITIPDGVTPGMVFQASADGFTFQAICPGVIPEGRRIRIVPPPLPPEPPKAMQYFRVDVPSGIKAGDQFAAVIDNSHERLEVLVECPQGRAGKTIMVSLPTQTVVGKIALSYESHRRSGWRRTVRASDLQFQWVRMRKESAITESVARFDFFKSAFVRQIILLEGNDPQLCTASLRLVPAAEAVTASKLRLDGKTIISYADVAKQQARPLPEKHEWFLGICRELNQLRSTVTSENPGDVVNDVYVEIFVRREHLLRDGMRGVMSLSVAQMQANWRIRWLGEPALDDGGLTKEFFHLVTEELLDPAAGLFYGESVVDINPLSMNEGSKDTSLMYYRFAGRLLGRALFSNHQIKGHLVRTLHKHLLGWPLTYEDVRDQDEASYNSCKILAEGIDDVSGIWFSVTEMIDGKRMDNIELVDGGANIEVTRENRAEYLEARLRYMVFDRFLPQLTELLLGFYDVIPEPALTVFDAGELELLLCGLPTIDVKDWKDHTVYTGEFERLGSADPVVEWFWELVEEFDAEMRARLLQFATGTSSVPSSGFKGLCGHNGKRQKFTLHGVTDPDTCFYPKSHTCFNQIDCQRYKSKELLKERLTVSITVNFVGFSDE